jgi:exopolyphosphatase/guanosine-5'-triphosphate,3'-diphosphate pyrophosphatase
VPAPERVAVVDVGSNTARVLVARRAAGAHVEVLDELGHRLELARRLDERGALPPDAIEAVVAALRDFRALALGAGADGLRVVATSAVRDARNGAELARQVRELGLELDVLDGASEGRFAFLGAVYGVPVDSGVLVDLGGGSMELSRFRDRELTASVTLPLGTLRARARFLADDPPSEQQAEALRGAVRDAVQRSGMGRLARGEALVATGGAARNLAKIDRARRSRYPVALLHGYALGRERLRRLAEQLAGPDARARAATPGLNPQRAETIVAGALVLGAAADALGARELLVSGQGLREGVLRDALGERLPAPSCVREDAVDSLLARFALADAGRPERRAALARELAETLDLELAPELADALRQAARLLEVGAAVGFYNRHRNAAELALESDLAGFSHRALAQIAALLRLAEKPRWRVAQLAPLLRAADEPELHRAATVLALADELLRREPPDSRGATTALSSNGGALHVRPADGVAWQPGAIAERVREQFGRELRVAGAS